MICEVMRRMNALSSTMRTRGFLEDTRALAQRPHFDASIRDEQIDGAPVIAPRILGDDRHSRALEHLANSSGISLTDVHRAASHQVREHARAADNLRLNAVA